MTDSLILYLEKHSPATGPELCRHLGITRQGLSRRVKPLIASGAVIKSGSTRAARYFAAGKAPTPNRVARSLPLASADESRVYDEFAARLNLATQLRPNVGGIVHYAFTEMLNNAIEHSHASLADATMQVDSGVIGFAIRDRGIGLFHSIAAKLALPDEHAAMVELLKGRTTTMPEAHSGEGIFFTARAADTFVLRSHRIRLEWDGLRTDIFAADQRFMKGTTVEFRVRRDTRRELKAIFETYAPEEYDYRFERTKILVRLLRADYVSRSEARRLTENLQKFQEVELDFSGVSSIGQGFADEVFRVFAHRHPATSLVACAASPAVAAMIRHVGGTVAK
jgi:anti-sigma regulatory factor (Ser/Thr protein kinase)